jgi:hypothetical protein
MPVATLIASPALDTSTAYWIVWQALPGASQLAVSVPVMATYLVMEALYCQVWSPGDEFACTAGIATAAPPPLSSHSKARHKHKHIPRLMIKRFMIFSFVINFGWED